MFFYWDSLVNKQKNAVLITVVIVQRGGEQSKWTCPNNQQTLLGLCTAAHDGTAMIIFIPSYFASFFIS